MPDTSPVKKAYRHEGATLIEMMVVLSILILFVSWTQLNLFGVLRRNTFKATLQEFVDTMQMAAVAAAQSDRRYEVIIDPDMQTYLLREISTPQLSEVLEEEIITEGKFSKTCRLYYVVFDDGEMTDQARAKFRAGRSGWQYGGKIVFLDEEDQPYSLIINRLNRTVTLQEGDVALLKPVDRESMFF
jgi:Tfp pilus assembly protein FimT